MTLTPAIKEALLKYASTVSKTWALSPQKTEEMHVAAASHLLSVVAAEEGRKYTGLVKLHREWVEATKAVKDHDFGHAYHLGGDPEGAALVAAAEAALSALAQWEAPTRCTCDDTSLASSYQRCPIDSHNAEGL